MVCRKFQFQAFNYIDKNGKGTLKPEDASECSPATAFLVSDHLSQLIITDGMSREGMSRLFTCTLLFISSIARSGLLLLWMGLPLVPPPSPLLGAMSSIAQGVVCFAIHDSAMLYAHADSFHYQLAGVISSGFCSYHRFVLQIVQYHQ